MDDIALFIHLVECGSLSAAAKYLGIPNATVTRRLQKLEHRLGLTLVHRSARRFTLTSDGQIYYHAYAELIRQMEDTARQLSKESQQMTGPLTVLAPSNLSSGLLMPVWESFATRYPDVRLNLKLNNNLEDLVTTRGDLAIRVGNLPDSSLYQKRLGSIPTLLVAAPEYIAKNGTPDSLAEIEKHRVITNTDPTVWTLTRANKSQTLHPTTHLVVNDVTMVKRFVLGAQGIALLPMSEVAEELKEGRLTHILPDYAGPHRHVYAVWPGGRILSKKATALRDLIETRLAKN